MEQAHAVAKDVDPWKQEEPTAPWKQEANSWGKKDSLATGEKAPAATPSAKAFWEAQQQNKDYGTLSRKQDWELEQGNVQLFQSRLGSNAGIDFGLYGSVPMEVSRSKANMISVFRTFEELYKEMHELVPEEVIGNVRRCAYSKATPLRRYAMPAGLVGRENVLRSNRLRQVCCVSGPRDRTHGF